MDRVGSYEVDRDRWVRVEVAEQPCARSARVVRGLVRASLYLSIYPSPSVQYWAGREVPGQLKADV